MLSFHCLAFKHLVSSLGWHIGPKDEDKTKMRATSFQAKEGRQWISEEEKGKDKMEAELENIKWLTFPHQTDIGHKVMKYEANAENASEEWSTTTGSQQEKGEEVQDVMEDVVGQNAVDIVSGKSCGGGGGSVEQRKMGRLRAKRTLVL